MTTKYSDLHPTSKVWIFQSTSELSDIQSAQIKQVLDDFLQDWTAHNQALKTYGDVWHHRFVVLIVDETYTHASGCSVDKMTRFIQELGNQYGIDLLDRMQVAYLTTDKTIKTAHLNDLASKVQTGEIETDTLVFNNLVANKSDFENKWQVKISDSWHQKFI
jgi:uncharacterized membrane protein YheB (UPF0754 family)